MVALMSVSSLRSGYRWCRRGAWQVARAAAWSGERRVSCNSKLSWLEMWHEQLRLVARPRVVQVGCNLACNLRCSFCRLWQPDFRAQVSALPREEREISDRVLQQLMKIAPYAERVTLTPLGEPLIWSGFGELLERVRRAGCANLEMTSNGMLLEQFAPVVCGGAMSAITLSVDSNDADIYAGMRIGGDLAQVQRGIRAVVARRGTMQIPQLMIAATFMRRNIEQLPAMVRWAADLGVDKFAVQLMDSENPEQESEHLSHCPELAQRTIAQAVAVADELRYPLVLSPGISAFLRRQQTDDSARPRRSLVEQCSDPWGGLLIDTDGDCRPCCWAGISYGNLNALSFDEMWNGATAQQTRRMFLANTLPDGCTGRHCRVQ